MTEEKAERRIRDALKQAGFNPGQYSVTAKKVTIVVGTEFVEIETWQSFEQMERKIQAAGRRQQVYRRQFDDRQGLVEAKT